MGKGMSPLVAAILTQQAKDLAYTTNAVIDAVTRERDRAEATLAAIRYHVEDLCSGPYAPNTIAILRCLYPEPEVIARFNSDAD